MKGNTMGIEGCYKQEHQVQMFRMQTCSEREIPLNNLIITEVTLGSGYMQKRYVVVERGDLKNMNGEQIFVKRFELCQTAGILQTLYVRNIMSFDENNKRNKVMDCINERALLKQAFRNGVERDTHVILGFMLFEDHAINNINPRLMHCFVRDHDATESESVWKSIHRAYSLESGRSRLLNTISDGYRFC